MSSRIHFCVHIAHTYVALSLYKSTISSNVLSSQSAYKLVLTVSLEHVYAYVTPLGRWQDTKKIRLDRLTKRLIAARSVLSGLNSYRRGIHRGSARSRRYMRFHPHGQHGLSRCRSLEHVRNKKHSNI